jgi:hypothetical protein
MFSYAQFPIPMVLPPLVPVWRGTSGITVTQAMRGLSWTLDRALACWFATRWNRANGAPLVLHAVVPRESIELYHNRRDEREAVVFDVPNAQPDGDPGDWCSHGNRIQELLQAEHRARLDKARQLLTLS